jgi:tetratricopeptide (TPR) repeat protein
MSRSWWAGFGVAVYLSLAGLLFSQGSLHRPVPQTSTTDSSGNLKTESESKADHYRGSVQFANGLPPNELVEIVGVCSNAHRIMAVADSKGRFSFDIDPRRQSEMDLLHGCSLFASLEGYRSDVVDLNEAKKRSVAITLTPISENPNGLSIKGDDPVAEAHRKIYQKAIDRASKREWKDAAKLLEQVTEDDPTYSLAWVALGTCQQNLGQRTDADKSYLEAARVDPNYALPWIRAAAIEAVTGNAAATLLHSQKAIDLNPQAFPDAYSLNVIAGLGVQNLDTAEKNAMRGLALDTAHQYPELEFALGMVFYAKGDLANARTHLANYVAESPNGPNLAAAQSQLAQMRTPDLPTANTPQPASALDLGPQTTSAATGTAPTPGVIEEHNASLLSNPTAYTCLESILPAKLDQRGHPTILDTTRLDIAISDGKEIYGSPTGKHFSGGSGFDLLGYEFTTTGLFSSIARALVTPGQFAIEPAGQLVWHGETLVRFNFHSLPTTPGWNIAYGKESGIAAEKGWFLVESTTLVLRRVFLSAADIPSHLKLSGLNALIEYEPETVGGHRVLLPSLARIEVSERSGSRRISLLSFDHCRAFAAESNVSFAETSESTQAEQAIHATRLPNNLEVVVALKRAVSPATVAQNDLLAATVIKSVTQGAREWIPAGAAIEGHVRPVRGSNALILQLDRVQTSIGWQPFYAQLLKITTGKIEISETPIPTTGKDELKEPEVPGVAQINLEAGQSELPAGTQMLWRIEPLQATQRSLGMPQLNTSMAMH